jgi:branched-chain amino acid transport system permease protein
MVFVMFGIDVVSFCTGLLAFFSIYLIISLSLNLEVGYAGIPNFGQVLFFAGGAAFGGAFAGRLAVLILNIGNQTTFITQNYAVVQSINNTLASNIPLSAAIFLLSLLIAGATGAAFGYIASFPAIRLREDFLGMTLLAAGQFFYIFLNNYPPLANGNFGIAVPDVFKWAGDYRTEVAALVIALFAIGVYLYVERVGRSPLSRLLRAMRDNEITSEAIGKDNISLKRRTLMVGCAIAGVAGMLYAFYAGDVVAGAVGDRVAWTFYPWIMLLLGGQANNLGVAAGAFLFEFLQEIINIEKFSLQTSLPFDVNWLQYMLFAAILVIILYLRPQGIKGETPSITLSRDTVVGIFGRDKPPSQPTGGSDQNPEIPVSAKTAQVLKRVLGTFRKRTVSGGASPSIS